MGVTAKVVYMAMVAVGLYYLKQYTDGPPCTSQARIDGKVVVITGANVGLGKESAAELARRGGKIYLACRSVERGTRAVEDILEDNPTVDASNLLVMQLDLGSVASIRAFVTEFKKRERKLDILMNNGGVYHQSNAPKTEDGFESTFGINHLGHFLLTNLLMDEIVGAAPSRVVTVSSVAHKRGSGTINLEDPMAVDPYDVWGAYGQSKLANIIFSKELGKRLKGTGVTTYSLHPGRVDTDMFRQAPVIGNPLIYPLFKWLAWPLMRDVTVGAQTQICCAVSEDLANETGKYYVDSQETAPEAPGAFDDDLAIKLWDLSVKLLKMKDKDIHPKLRS